MRPAAVPITDPGDGRVDDYRHLSDARRRRRMEAPGADGSGQPGFFVAEGPHVIRRLLASGRRVRSVLLDPARAAVLAGDLAGVDAPVYLAAPDVLAQVAGFDVHRGALASADRWPLPQPAEVLAGAGLVVVVEGINDHENLGSLFRNSAALGADALLLCPRCCDPLYRRSVRVSMGHVLSVPWSRLDPWPGALGEVRAAGLTLVALTPDPDAEPLDRFPAPARVAVLAGAEGPGLSPAALAAADRRVRIPMAGAVDSLNVATAAAIALYSLRRSGEP